MEDMRQSLGSLGSKIDTMSGSRSSDEANPKPESPADGERAESFLENASLSGIVSFYIAKKSLDKQKAIEVPLEETTYFLNAWYVYAYLASAKANGYLNADLEIKVNAPNVISVHCTYMHPAILDKIDEKYATSKVEIEKLLASSSDALDAFSKVAHIIEK